MIISDEGNGRREEKNPKCRINRESWKVRVCYFSCLISNKREQDLIFFPIL